jgi:hypothetical protein
MYRNVRLLWREYMDMDQWVGKWLTALVIKEEH